MKVAVIGGGIIGLFAAYYLKEEEVTIFEKEELGFGSVHAAGLIEPYRFDKINSLSMIKKMLKFRKEGVTTLKEVDKSWLLTLLRELERKPPQDAWDTVREMAAFSLSEYKRMAEERNDFMYKEDGLLEVYSSTQDLEKGLEEERKSPFKNKFEEVDIEGFAGGIFFPELSRLSTESFIERIKKEINAKVVKKEVSHIKEGKIGTRKYDVVIVTAGVNSREFIKVPLTAFRGVGFRVKGKPVLNYPFVHVKRGIAISPLDDHVKLTGGFDADFSAQDRREEILNSSSDLIKIEEIIDIKSGFRPCSPDGFPILGKVGNVIISTGACRLGWSYAPAMGKAAADLVYDRRKDYGYLSRFVKE